MDNIIKFINDNETVVMTALFIMIILLAVAVFITDYLSKRRSKKLRNGLILEDDKKDELSLEPDATTQLSNLQDNKTQEIEEIIPDAKPVEIKYVDEDSELEKTRAQIELKNLKDELIKADREEKEHQRQIELEKTKEIEIIEDDKAITSSNKIDDFEKAQEENAIISLDQFNKVSDKIYETNEVTQYKDEGNEPISIAELEKLYNASKEQELLNNEVEIISSNAATNERKETVSMPIGEFKFKKSPIISPVYGIDKDETLSNISVENTANLDKLAEEIRKTNEFLNTLKELRKNL